MKDKTYKWALSLLCGGVFMLSASQLKAEEAATKMQADADRGKAVAERLCVSCHVVSQDSSGTVPEGVPPFTVIANQPQQTAQHIRGVLIEPHPPMPDLHLTRLEIEDIIAFIDELREQESGPPLLPDKGPKEPKVIYPDAS